VSRETAIALHSVSKVLGRGQLETLVLSDISWAIERRSRVVVLGQRGSGKSTLLHIISGLMVPSRGWVERRARISVPGGLLRYGHTGSARHLISRLSTIYGVDAAQALDFVANLAEIEGLMDFPLPHLTRALRTRLNIALTYAFPFDVYIFDAVVDWGISPRMRELCEKIHNVRVRDASIIVATSSTSVARSVGGDPSGAILHKGQVTLFRSLEDAIAVFEDLPPPEIRGFLTTYFEEEKKDIDSA
jgi:capsular polysaccharide transport system ATP-binding protein